MPEKTSKFIAKFFIGAIIALFLGGFSLVYNFAKYGMLGTSTLIFFGIFFLVVAFIAAAIIAGLHEKGLI
jgi:hypothetical protein